MRYDRQIRLWGDEGQTSIGGTKVCMLGSSTIASEILKNLVLAGIKSFHIVDSKLLEPHDLGNNFFVTEESLGKPRAEVVMNMLLELNPGVSGSFDHQEWGETVAEENTWSQSELEQLLDYSIVVDTIGNSVVKSYLYKKRPYIEARCLFYTF